jgi:iron complex transport system substrate-binding protein
MGDVGEIEDKLKEDLMSNQAWAGLEAVRKGRVHYLPAEYFLYRPNDQFPEAFEYMAKILYK